MKACKVKRYLCSKASFFCFICFLLIISKSNPIYAQFNTHTFENLDSLQQVEERPIVVFLHTNWCKFCTMMKNTTFKDREVIDLLNDQFYFISFNAEQKQDVNFQGYTYKYKANGNTTGIHELVEQIGTVNGTVSYPTICCLNPQYEITFQYNSFLKREDMIAILKQLN